MISISSIAVSLVAIIICVIGMFGLILRRLRAIEQLLLMSRKNTIQENGNSDEST